MRKPGWLLRRSSAHSAADVRAEQQAEKCADSMPIAVAFKGQRPTEPQLLGSKRDHGLNKHGAPRWDRRGEKRDGEEQE
jgi:hypothetical protein